MSRIKCVIFFISKKELILRQFLCITARCKHTQGRDIDIDRDRACVHNSLEWLMKSFDAIKIKARCDHSFGTMKYICMLCACCCVVEFGFFRIFVVDAAAAANVRCGWRCRIAVVSLFDFTKLTGVNTKYAYWPNTFKCTHTINQTIPNF